MGILPEPAEDQLTTKIAARRTSACQPSHPVLHLPTLIFGVPSYGFLHRFCLDRRRRLRRLQKRPKDRFPFRLRSWPSSGPPPPLSIVRIGRASLNRVTSQLPLRQKEIRLLTPRHRAVLQAALRFFDEELTPHGSAAMRPYFDQPPRPSLKSREIQDLRDILRRCELRYVGYDPTTSQLVGTELSKTPEEALPLAESRNCLPATLLILPEA